MKRVLIFAAIVCALSAIFHGLGLFNVLPWHIVYSDTLGFFSRAVAPGIPYLDVKIEYPVLTGLFIGLMGKLGTSQGGYYFLSCLFLIGAAVFATYILYKLIGGWRPELWRYFIFAPSMFFFSVYNWDIFAVLFSLIAFYFVKKDRDLLGSFFIALGFCAKFFPALFLIPLLIKSENWSERIKVIGVFAGTALIINLPFMMANFGNWSYFYSLNQLRASNVDSIWTVLRFIFSPLLESVGVVNFISLILFIFVFIWAMRRQLKDDFLKSCFLAVLIFLIFNKVFSPQYILWLLPFFVIFKMPSAKWFYTLEFSNLATLFSVLPWFLVERNISYFYLSIPFVVLRHISLIYIFVQALKIKPAASLRAK